MGTQRANEDFPTRSPSSRLRLWRRVREFAVPQSMIETAGALRAVGDWGGACAAARVYVDFDLRTAASRHGRELAAQVRDDLRYLAPDLLRWHMPRIAPDGLLRPGLTVALAGYASSEAARQPLQLVARTPPGWADGGQRFSLALWDPTRPAADIGLHPHPHPSRRFRLDLHRHLWDTRRSPELRVRSGADLPDPEGPSRWAAEAAILLRAEGRSFDGLRQVGVRIGGRRLLVLDVADPAAPVPAASTDAEAAALPLLPDAATWMPPDLALLRAGLIEADALHPLVAAALVPGHVSARARVGEEEPTHRHVVDCRGARHRIAVVDGVLSPLDHDPDELRREELLAALGGPPLPCLQVIDLAHRRPRLPRRRARTPRPRGPLRRGRRRRGAARPGCGAAPRRPAGRARGGRPAADRPRSLPRRSGLLRDRAVAASASPRCPPAPHAAFPPALRHRPLTRPKLRRSDVAAIRRPLRTPLTRLDRPEGDHHALRHAAFHASCRSLFHRPFPFHVPTRRRR